MDDHNQRRDDKEEKTSYYYSYGPFKSSLDEQHESNTVEIHRPALPTHMDPQEQSSKTVNWSVPGKKKSSFRSMFASFLAGVIIMGSFMIAADRMNLFTGSDAVDDVSPYSAEHGSVISARHDVNDHQQVSYSSLDVIRPNTIADIVDAASPAVVKIETVVRSGGSGHPFQDEFFRRFFGDDFFAPQERRTGGIGSGFIFDKNGYILTNEHVLSGAEEIYVTVQGYKDRFKAKLLGSDYELDLAVIKIDGDKPFNTLKLGDSSKLRVGDWVTAIGNPIGFDHTVSVGVISANEREIQITDQRNTRTYKHLLQTDASINPGNSGGPLLNLHGEVIGINTAVSAQAQGIGFAIPSSTIIQVLDQLKNNQPIPKPYIGVYLANIDETWKENLNLKSTDGALVTQIQQNSPASRAGLQPGDVIIELNGTRIQDAETLSEKIKEFNVGDKITVKLIRDGHTLEAVLIIADRNKG